MQTLYLLRHAKSEPWAPGLVDFDRHLSDAGINHAEQIGLWMAEHLQAPDQVLCSPANRTRETLAPVSQHYGLEPGLIRYIPQIYEATPGTLMHLLDDGFQSGDRVLMVGHNPGFEYLLKGILQMQDLPKAPSLPTGTLAVVTFSNNWLQGKGNAALDHFVRGKHLYKETSD